MFTRLRTLGTADDADALIAIRIAGSLVLFVVVGDVFAIFHNPPFWSTVLLWASACLVSGGLLGFLFGIPKTLQGTATPSSRTPATTPPVVAAPSSGGTVFPATLPESAETRVQDFGQRVNTNLEDISDWLTKIFVGLGLAELRAIPAKLDQAALFAADGMGGAKEKNFAAALIIYFCIVGFVGSYLLTRLYVGRAFYAADFGRLIARVEQVAAKAGELAEGNQLVNAALKDLDTPRKGADEAAMGPLFQAHVSELEALKPKLPLSRGVFITLGRLYRRLRDYDAAIRILTEFIRNKQSAGQGEDSSTADAFYNLAAYLSLEAGSEQDATKKTQLTARAIQNLKYALSLAPQLAGVVANDDDFTALHSSAEYNRLTSTAVRAAAPEPPVPPGSAGP